MKKRIALLLILCLVAFGATALAESAAPTLYADNLHTTYTAADGTQIADVTAAIPQLVGAYDDEKITRLNALIAGQVMSDLAVFGDPYQYASGDYRSMLADGDNTWPDGGYTFWVNYEVAKSSAALLGLNFTVSAYYGGAHPGSQLMPLMIDLSTGSPVAIDLLVADKAAFHDFLVKSVLDQIAAQLKPADTEYMYFDDYQDTVKNLDMLNSYLTDEGLNVFFNEYDIAPYASGMPTFLIPNDALKPYLNDYGKSLIG